MHQRKTDETQKKNFGGICLYTMYREKITILCNWLKFKRIFRMGHVNVIVILNTIIDVLFVSTTRNSFEGVPKNLSFVNNFQDISLRTCVHRYFLMK